MSFKVNRDLLVLNSLAILQVIIVAVLPGNILRVALGIPFVVLLPGYMASCAAFPGKKDLGIVERAGLSAGVSFAVVSLAGLLFNYTPWGISLNPMLYFISGFVLLISAVVWFRRRTMIADDRFVIDIPAVSWAGFRQMARERLLSLSLGVAVVATVGILGYTLAFPRHAETYTAFYILGPEGRLENYPEKLVVGQQASVTVGIENHEQQEVNYSLAVVIGDGDTNEMTQITIDSGQKWLQDVSFSPDHVGQRQKVRFLLYRSGDSAPYRDLHLGIDVEADAT